MTTSEDSLTGSNDGSRPIGDYALLSDSQGAALVSRSGSIDWACLPRFDSPASFARLLDPAAGYWQIAPTEPFETTRAYVDDSLVLRTEFHTDTGTVAVTDALAFMPLERGHGIGQRSPHAVVRFLEGIEGTVKMASVVAPRPEYGLTVPRWRAVPGGARCHGGAAAYVLSCPTASDLDLDVGDATSHFTAGPGDRAGFALRVTEAGEPVPAAWTTDQIRAWLYGTIQGWQSWSRLHQRYQGPWAGLVHHSGRVLKALTYQPTGAVVAAPTTSLPEQIGGERNWDYRYSWVRDASLTLAALWVAACPDEVARFFEFFVNAAGAADHDADRQDCADSRLQVLYRVTGERRVEEQDLEHLRGYRDSRPVRVGNAAWRQDQLDVYGQLLDAAWLYADRVSSLDEHTAAFFVAAAEQAARRWPETDHGIWEIRGEPRHFVHSKLMCWVALDRAIRLAEGLDATSHAERWEHQREEIRSAILEKGWSDNVQAFTQAFGCEDLDAAVLLMPIAGFLPADDERVRATIDTIAHRLTDDRGLVHRYGGEDGLAGGEGTFTLCTFWLAHCLALAGDADRATEYFETAARHANDVGLLSEEVDTDTGELLGNFPQAFSHIGLVNAANAIAEARSRAES